MKRNVLAAVLAAAILAAPAVGAEAPYTDLGTLSSRAAIDYLYDIRCLTFAAGEQFLPDQALTRGDLAQLIYNVAANMPIVNPDFQDVQSGRAGDAIGAVASQGILSGYADGSFQPDQPVTREEFAGVIYRYLKYSHMDAMDGAVQPYADEDTIAPTALHAVQVLHSKNVMVPADNVFRPKEYITRAEAAEAVYHILHTDGQYISHVQVELQVMKCLNAEYGSTIAFFRSGTMYWNGDMLILGIKGSPGRYLAKRIQNTVDRADAVSIRRVRLSRTDYDQILNRAVNALVDSEGVQTYVGAVPDYIHEQVVITVRRPVSEATLQALSERVGKGLVRVQVMETPGKTSQVQQDGTAPDTNAKKEKADRSQYSPLFDQAMSDAITTVQNDVM